MSTISEKLTAATAWAVLGLLGLLALLAPIQACAVQTFIPAGGYALRTTTLTTLLTAEFTSNGSNGFLILASLPIYNGNTQTIQLTVTLSEASDAFTAKQQTFAVPAQSTFTYAVVIPSVTGLSAGSYTARVRVQQNTNAPLQFLPAGYLGVFSDQGVPGSVLTALGVEGQEQTGATQLFAITGAATGDCDGNTPCIDSTDNVHTWVLPNAASSKTGFVSTGAQTFNGLKTFIQGVSSPDSGGSSERFGTGTQADATSATAVGASAFVGSSATNGTAIGRGASVQGAQSTNLGASTDDNSNGDCLIAGYNSECSGAGGTAMGSGVTAAASGTAIGFGASAAANAVCVGAGANCVSSSGIGVGYGAAPLTGICLGNSCAAGANTFVAGSASQAMSTVYFGKGSTSSSATAVTISGTGGSGTNNAGAKVAVRGGPGTGTGIGGDVELTVCPAGSSGTTLNTATCEVAVKASGQNADVQLVANKATFSDTGPLLKLTDCDNTNNQCLQIAEQTAPNSYGVMNEDTDVSPFDSQNLTAAGNTLAVQHNRNVYLTADSSYTLSSEPTVAVGLDGQVVCFWNVDGAATITLHDDGDGGVASNLQLGAGTRALAQNDGLCLVYVGVLGDWLEQGFFNN